MRSPARHRLSLFLLLTPFLDGMTLPVIIPAGLSFRVGVYALQTGTY
ncbi:MAG: hypothetical protein ACUVSY_14590 [Roseiflexus sp.]